MNGSRRISLDGLQREVTATLAAVGVPHDAATATADALVTADAMGVFTHGTKLLVGYVRKLKHGGYRAAGRPRIERQGPAWAVIDGDSALGQVGCAFALDTAIRKAGETGVAYVGLRNTGHIGAAGYPAAVAARHGFACMVTGNDTPSVTAPRFAGVVLGSNPIAYGVPVPDGDPILLDIATAAVAGGKVYAAHQRGEPIPDTWLVDEQGRPTTDGSLYPHRANLAPMAGHKGYGFGLWCEVLSGVIPGGALTRQIGSWMFGPGDEPSRHNASLIVVDAVAIAGREAYERRIRSLVDEIHAAPTADGVDRVRLPGDLEWERYHRAAAEGIELPTDVVAKLDEAMREAGRS